MNLDDYAHEITNLHTDVRLEVILAELYGGGLDPRTDVLIHPSGLFERSYRRDVGRVIVGHADALIEDLPEEDEKRRSYLNIEVHRDGLYHYLPEGLFHQPVNRGRDQGEVFDDIDEQARRGQAARKFFQPFEQEFFLQRTLLELEERKYSLTEENIRQNDQGMVLRQFWDIPRDLLNTRQLHNLLYLLPVAHRIVHNQPLVTACFSLILGVHVALKTLPPLIHLIELAADDEPVSDELGRAEMGKFSLGGVYQDTMPVIEISIGPLNKHQLNGFLQGGRSRDVLNMLIGYFMPAELDVVDHLIISEEDSYLVLVDDDPTAVLGVASYI